MSERSDSSTELDSMEPSEGWGVDVSNEIVRQFRKAEEGQVFVVNCEAAKGRAIPN